MNWRVKAQFAERIRMIAARIIAKHPEDDRSSPVNESNDQPKPGWSSGLSLSVRPLTGRIPP
jgi:hypothetical protein